MKWRCVATQDKNTQALKIDISNSITVSICIKKHPHGKYNLRFLSHAEVSQAVFHFEIRQSITIKNPEKVNEQVLIRLESLKPQIYQKYDLFLSELRELESIFTKRGMSKEYFQLKYIAKKNVIHRKVKFYALVTPENDGIEIGNCDTLIPISADILLLYSESLEKFHDNQRKNEIVDILTQHPGIKSVIKTISYRPDLARVQIDKCIPIAETPGLVFMYDNIIVDTYRIDSFCLPDDLVENIESRFLMVLQAYHDYHCMILDIAQKINSSENNVWNAKIAEFSSGISLTLNICHKRDVLWVCTLIFDISAFTSNESGDFTFRDFLQSGRTIEDEREIIIDYLLSQMRKALAGINHDIRLMEVNE